MRPTNSRCDQIIALIDACLAEYELASSSLRNPTPKGAHDARH